MCATQASGRKSWLKLFKFTVCAPPPNTHIQFGQLEQLFSDVKIQDLNISSEQKYNMRNKVEKLKDEIMEKPNLQDPPCPPDQTR